MVFIPWSMKLDTHRHKLYQNLRTIYFLLIILTIYVDQYGSFFLLLSREDFNWKHTKSTWVKTLDIGIQKLVFREVFDEKIKFDTSEVLIQYNLNVFVTYFHASNSKLSCNDFLQCLKLERHMTLSIRFRLHN